MSRKKFSEKVRDLYTRVFYALRPPFLPITRRIRKLLEGFSGSGSTKPQVFAYQLVGEKTTRMLPLFRDVDVNLQKSELRIGFRAYVSWAILASLLVSVSTLVLIPFSLVFIAHFSLASSLLFGVGGALFAGAFTVIGFYAYPIFRADSLKNEVEGELPFTTSYMAILAGAGVSPDHIFISLTNPRVSPKVSVEARTIVRDMELFGFDVVSALENASKRTPSERFKEMLEGFIGTIHSGGNLSAYLTSRSRQYMELKRISLRKFSDTLSILAEFYVTLLVAGPLIFVVLLAVMGMLGGGGSGLMDPRLLLDLLTYLGIPLGSLAFLILLDIISPRG
jgi:flagellar protein FlaJ